MQSTRILQGASRLPLTPKRGNKDFYKGTGQAYVPGGGHRTGPPGKHVIGGKAKFRIQDEKVRYYVGPGLQVMENTELRPYVSTQHARPLPTKYSKTNPPLSFSPNIHHLSLSLPRRVAPSSLSAAASQASQSIRSETESESESATSETLDITTSSTPSSPSSPNPSRYIKPHDTKAFSRWYNALPHPEKNKLIQETRKEWYLGMVAKQRGLTSEQSAIEEERNVEESEEAKTRKVEGSL